MTGGASPERTSAASPAAASPAAASPVAASSAAAPPISGALSAESSVAYVQRECWPVGRLIVEEHMPYIEYARGHVPQNRQLTRRRRSWVSRIGRRQRSVQSPAPLAPP